MKALIISTITIVSLGVLHDVLWELCCKLWNKVFHGKKVKP